MKYFEVEFEDGYSVAYKGVSIPTIEQAQVFCENDRKECGNIISVHEIDREEAYLFFDTDNIDQWPVYGI